MSEEPTGREICPSCGVIAPRSRRSCSLCEAPLDSRQPIPTSADGSHWVAIRSFFQCRSCGHLSPLNHLDLDGSVQCHHCGLDQAFDVESWHDGLEHAHAVGDLAGPAPEGLHPHPRISIIGCNPMARVGVDLTLSEFALSGMASGDGMVLARSLKVEAGPGHPLCPACKVPLKVAVQGDQTATRCERCGKSAEYALPDRARALCEGVRGIMADDMRSDRPPVKAELSGGVLALTCPGCGAGLQGADVGKTVSCTFCNTVSRVPDRLALRYMDRKPVPETWWLQFEGPSPARRALEDTSTLSDEAKKKAEVTQTPARDLPRPIRFFMTVVIPTVVMAAVGVFIFIDKIWEILQALGIAPDNIDVHYPFP